MSNNKKASNPSSTITHSYTETFFKVYAFLFLVAGLALLFFTKEVTIITTPGKCEKLSIIVQQFLANTYLFIGFLIFFVRKTEGRVMTNIIVSFILAGFINLYLLFSLKDYAIVPSVYFIAQIVMQLSIFITLFDQVKKK